ncbi:MAG: ribosome maturation factor RimP [Thermodesulfobacteriota bacterium]
MENLDPVVQQISELIDPVLVDLGYELVEVQFRGEQHGQVLRIVIYKESGIGLEDCARVSREVGHLLEVEDVIEQAFNLEVTSPGLDWRLKNERDFARCANKKVRIVMKDGSEALVGLIVEVGEDRVALDIDGNKKVVFFDEIKKAKLVIEF